MFNTDDMYRYAVKRIPRLPSEVKHTEKINWKFEAERMLAISEPTIQVPIDYFTDKVYNYLVYDHNTLGSLRVFLQSPTIPPQFVPKAVCFIFFFSHSRFFQCFWKISADLIKGLSILHSMSVVHCGIKPENIFRKDTYNFFIGDVGFPKIGRPGAYYYATHSGDLFVHYFFWKIYLHVAFL